jgi:hypothetical protein
VAASALAILLSGALAIFLTWSYFSPAPAPSTAAPVVTVDQDEEDPHVLNINQSSLGTGGRILSIDTDARLLVLSTSIGEGDNAHVVTLHCHCKRSMFAKLKALKVGQEIGVIGWTPVEKDGKWIMESTWISDPAPEGKPGGAIYIGTP